MWNNYAPLNEKFNVFVVSPTISISLSQSLMSEFEMDISELLAKMFEFDFIDVVWGISETYY